METAVKRRISVYDLVMVGLFAALIAVCAWITVPGTIPFTLQTMGVFLAVGLLGGKRGTAAVLVYILLGAVGMPVFSGFSGGVSPSCTSTFASIRSFSCSIRFCKSARFCSASAKSILSHSPCFSHFELYPSPSKSQRAG